MDYEIKLYSVMRRLNEKIDEEELKENYYYK